jgi:predicted metal-binding protein
MTLKIERSLWRGLSVLSLTGHFEAEHIAELHELLELQADFRSVILDLREIRLADRNAVEFLVGCEAQGIKLKNCPAYIREWIEREKK